jgi:hypothetical protein
VGAEEDELGIEGGKVAGTRESINAEIEGNFDKPVDIGT